MELEHAERRLWAEQVSSINKRLNQSGDTEPWRSWVPEWQGA